MAKNEVVRDSYGVPIGVSPIGIATVVKDQEIPHRAIVSTTGFDFYFKGAPEKTWHQDPQYALAINSEIRLKSDVECLVY